MTRVGMEHLWGVSPLTRTLEKRGRGGEPALGCPSQESATSGWVPNLPLL